MKKFPSISIALPVFNEGKRIKKVLSSIFSQNYPKSLIEVLVVDDDSTDDTVAQAKKFPVKILRNGTHDAERGKLIALKCSKGELFTYTEGDLLLRGKNWVRLMVKPLVEDQKVVASFTRYYSRKEDPALNKFLTLDPIQRDPLHRFFTPGVGDCVVETRLGYFVCQYEKEKIVPQGLCLYRKSALMPFYKNKVADKDRFLELDNLVYLIERGHKLFAYVPNAGYYHEHVSGIFDFLGKRQRNLIKVFLLDEERRRFRWVNFETFDGRLKALLWVVYAESFVLPLIAGFLRLVKYKSLVALYEPIVAWLETNVLILSLLKEAKGRKFLVRAISSFLHTLL